MALRSQGELLRMGAQWTQFSTYERLVVGNRACPPGTIPLQCGPGFTIMQVSGLGCDFRPASIKSSSSPADLALSDLKFQKTRDFG